MISDAERERLVLLAEECMEVAKEAMKVLRFGWSSVDPSTGVTYDNRALLETEVGNLNAVARRMINEGDMTNAAVLRAEGKHHFKIPYYTIYQPDSKRSDAP